MISKTFPNVKLDILKKLGARIVYVFSNLKSDILTLRSLSAYYEIVPLGIHTITVAPVENGHMDMGTRPYQVLAAT